MNKKYILSHTLNISSILLSILAPAIYAFNKYANIMDAQTGLITLATGLTLVFALRYVLYRLKMTAQDGFGMSKELAREMRFFIPMGIFLAVVLGIESNVAGVSDVTKVALVFNLIAAPLRLISYRLSRRYENDTGVQKMISKM